ncbi:MAG: proline dehydrogenase family protein, partial [Candidatus Sumerlaeia bacterium]|nr:proline dehydrogenase family protein [Candidatus Sumerlaeia bacterium]
MTVLESKHAESHQHAVAIALEQEVRPPVVVDAALESALEADTVAFGKKLFAAVEKHKPNVLSIQRANDFIMQLMMKDEDLRYRMLRFVDVYPAVCRGASLTRHLEEYLTHPDLSSGKPQTTLSTLARQIGRERSSTKALIRWASSFGIKQMGSQFIAGNTPETVAPKIRRMESEGFMFSLDLLGEFVVSEKQADHYFQRYMEMVQRFGKLLGPSPAKANKASGPRVNISIKLSSQTSKFEVMDPHGTSERVRERLRPLLRAALKHQVFLNVDMEKFEYRDLTFRIILDLFDEEEFRGFPYLGIVHQAYLKDADDCLTWFLSELRKRNQQMTIRLVKGAYWDSEQIWARMKNWPVPVITQKRLTDAMYEKCLRILMQNTDVVRVAVASHNVRSIAHALALKKHYRVPTERFEFQVLYGMAGPIKDALLAAKMPVRIYTPCGELVPGMAYLVRRILENTSNESFLRQRFTEGAKED